MPSNFKVLAGASGEPIDPNFRNVTLLLHGDGNNGGQNNAFVDSSSNHFPISRNGNTTQGSFSPYGSNWSNYFDGSGDYLSLPDNAALELGSSDITIEMWINTTNSTQYSTLYSRSPNFFVSGDWTLLMNNSSSTGGEVGLYVANYSISSPLLVTSGVSVRDGAWHHIAVVRNGSSWTIYIDGVSRATATWSGTVADVAGGPWIGKDQSFNRDYVGYISNLRFVKGTAVYTSAFTPSTTPLTAISGTSLLTCAYNRFRDGSTNNFTITRNGDVKVTNFAPFAPSSAAAYDQSDVQYWSGSFDGNGDFLQISGSSAFSIATSTTPFTIEGWIYPTAAGGCVFSEEYTGTGNSVSIAVIMSDGTSETTGRYITFGCYTGTTWILSAVSNVEVALNTWTHVACVFTGSTTKIYFNGVDVTKTSSPTPATTWGVTGVNGSAWFVGRRWDTTGTAYFTGYISNFRFVNGTAVYASAFTPPTSPLTAITNTSLLTCQNAAFTDNSANKFAITANGNATVVGNSPYNPVGYWSNSFDGNGDYLTVPNNTAFDFGSGNWTVEAWVYPNSLSSPIAIISKRTNSDYDYRWIVSTINTNGTISTQITTTGSSWPINANTTSAVSAGQWSHIAWVRNGSDVSVYVNGVKNTLSAGFSGSIYVSTEPLNIGVGGTTGSYVYSMNGSVSNLRIVKGTAVYTSNFTPPTTPLTAISGTSLLTCQANRFIDSSANAFTITPNGNVAVSDFDPFTGASVTSTGGSAYFDGSGDYLTVASNAAFNVSSGDWTVQGWYYTGTYDANNRVICSIGSSGDNLLIATIGSNGYLYYLLNDAVVISTTSAAPANSWAFFALVKSGSTTTLYLNGTSIGTTTSVPTSSNKQLVIGRAYDASSPYSGYVSDLRILKGTANTTVPTSPLTNITNTSILCNFTNAAIFDNSMKNDLETVGNAQISTSVKKFGTGSMYFDGNGDYLASRMSSDLVTFGNGDFTIEMWIYFNDVTTLQCFYDQRPSGTQGAYPAIYVESGTLRFNSNTTDLITTSVSTGQWYHIAVTRSGNTTRLFKDGVSAGTYGTLINYLNGGDGRPGIGGGGFSTSTFFLNGYIDDLRITKGVARYTANFTPPTAPFPNK